MKEAAIDGRNVQTLGQVVHNPQVVAELEEIGISVKQDRAADGATADTVAITAHGVGETTVTTQRTGLQRHRHDVSVRRPFPARRQASRRQGFHHLIFGDPDTPRSRVYSAGARGAGSWSRARAFRTARVHPQQDWRDFANDTHPPNATPPSSPTSCATASTRSPRSASSTCSATPPPRNRPPPASWRKRWT